MASTIESLKPKNNITTFPSSVIFLIRAVIVLTLTALIMWEGHVNIGAIGQGLSYGLVGVAVYISFRVLDFPDLSVDGSFPIGGAIAATLIVHGTKAEYTLLAAFIGGALAGGVTALIHILFKIEGLLASIIVMTGAYSIVLRIMGTSNIPLLSSRTILRPYIPDVRDWLLENYGRDYIRHSSNLVEIGVFSIILVVVLSVIILFLHTEIGLAMRASGKNKQMVRAIGVDDRLMIIIGLMLSNGLAGLAGALVVQQLGFADVQIGVGVIIRGLAAVMVGEVLFRPRTVGQAVLSATAGMVIFEVSRAWVFTALDLQASDVRFISSMVVLAALAAPYMVDRFKAWQRRRQMENMVDA